MGEFAVKVRRQDTAKFKFLSSGGGLNSLRIHALRFQTRETAQEVADKSAPMNPGSEWKVVPLEGGL